VDFQRTGRAIEVVDVLRLGYASPAKKAKGRM
jgi:hypothetical protein